MIYDFKCNDCAAEFVVHCRISERNDDHACVSCGSINTERQIIGAPAIGDAVRRGVRTVDNGFREVLSKIHEKTYRSNLDSKLSRS